MTPAPPPIPEEHWRARLPSARRTMGVYCALFFGGILIGPPIGLVCAAIHSYLFLEPGLGNPGDASEPWLLFLTWGVVIAPFLMPLWGIIAFLFCTIIWLPLWLTQGWHPLFRRPLYATLVGALLAALMLIGGHRLLGDSAPKFNPPANAIDESTSNSFAAGGVAGIAITGGLAFLATCRLRRRHSRVPSEAINAQLK